MKKMLAAVFEREGKLTLKEVPVPEIKNSDDVFLEIEAASVCGTDVHILEVPPGLPAKKGVILGHECVSKILEVGKEVTEFKPGDRAVIAPNITCDSCVYCKMGMPNMCENMIALGESIDGVFVKYSVVPVKVLHRVSPDLPAELAVFAEPLSCVVNATQKLKVQPGESVVVLGAGPIGLLFTRMFKASGAGKIIVSEPSQYRAKYAYNSGATRVVNPLKENLEKIVKEETIIGSDVIVDAVGTLFEETMGIVHRGGRFLLFGQNSKAKSTIVQNDITQRELTIMGSYIDKYTFPTAIKIIETGVLNLEELITHRFPLKDIHKGIEAMRNREAIKVVITSF